MLRKRFAASVSKDPSAPEQNEDAFGCDDARQLYVVSDGASESFNSRLWSRVLVGVGLELRPRKPRAFCQALRHCINVYEDWCKAKGMSWAEEASFARGSFATFLSVRAGEQPGQALVLGTGDSLAVLAADGAVVSSFPYTTAAQFSERPHLLSTRAGLNRLGGIDIASALRSLCREEPSGPLHRRWALAGLREGRLLCMTDALGAWLLHGEKTPERLRTLLAIQREEELRDLVVEERKNRRMRTDDSTLVVLGWNDASPDA